MIVILNTQETKHPKFEDLETGAVFLEGGSCWMKIYPETVSVSTASMKVEAIRFNAIRLDSTTCYKLAADLKVKPIQGAFWED